VLVAQQQADTISGNTIRYKDDSHSYSVEFPKDWKVESSGAALGGATNDFSARPIHPDSYSNFQILHLEQSSWTDINELLSFYVSEDGTLMKNAGASSYLKTGTGTWHINGLDISWTSSTFPAKTAQVDRVYYAFTLNSRYYVLMDCLAIKDVRPQCDQIAKSVRLENQVQKGVTQRKK
jgi:hypothetical protein